MSAEQALLDECVAHPDDITCRLVYADYLEERGDVRAEFLRLQCELQLLDTKHEDYVMLFERAGRMRRDLDSKWLATLGYDSPPIELCDIEFKFACPKEWDQLALTDDENTRFCSECSRRVFYCDTIDEARFHATRNECVAVADAVNRYLGDLNLESDSRYEIVDVEYSLGEIVLPEDEGV